MNFQAENNARFWSSSASSVFTSQSTAGSIAFKRGRGGLDRRLEIERHLVCDDKECKVSVRRLLVRSQTNLAACLVSKPSKNHCPLSAKPWVKLSMEGRGRE